MSGADGARSPAFGTSEPRKPIRVLTPDVTNKIAAGEVIERPASVVKELVENAIDARAQTVSIEVKGGGKELIRVRDDGHGIPTAEAAVAFRRHATSKIDAADDLVTIHTLGFRGEALPSIASVSRVELLTRTADRDDGLRLEVEGESIEETVSGAPVGTQVSVRELFYNTPARYKFLKTDATERRYIAEYVSHMALAHADVAFRLTMEGKEILKTPGSGNLKEAVAAVYGRQVVPELVAVEWESPWAVISGYVGKPVLAKGNRSQESVFINGRWVQNRLLTAAIEKGYESLLAHRRFPLAVLDTRVDPTLIDVNVHPAKTEVRFKDERETFKAVMLSVRKALTRANLVVDLGHGAGDEERSGTPDARSEELSRQTPQSRLNWGRRSALRDGVGSRDASRSEAREFGAVWEGEARSENCRVSDVPRESVEGLRSSQGDSEHLRAPLAEAAATRQREERLRELAREGIDPRDLLVDAQVLGQISRTYLVLAVPMGLWLIDQHVAHERILFEHVLQGKESEGRVPVQKLLVPQTLSLTPRQAATLDEHVEDLGRLGFEIESFGGRDYLLRGVPAALAGGEGEHFIGLLEELVSHVLDGGPSLVERSAASIACKAAVKAGDVLQPEAMNHLVRSLAEVENPFACPHGRPIILQLSSAEIGRRFGRGS